MSTMDLFAAMGGVDDALIERSIRKATPWPAWKKWTAAAACLCLVLGGVYGAARLGFLGRMGGSNAGGGGGQAGQTYMSYAGPVFPLDVSEGGGGLTAERRVDFDFSPWHRVWWSNEDEAASRTGLTEAERQEVLSDYNEWYPEGGRWQSSSDVWVTDAYTLTNPTGEDRTATLLYPFAASLSNLSRCMPTLTVDGAKVEPSLHIGSYAGGYEGAWGSEHTEEALNLRQPSRWEDYQALLSDGSYRARAMEAYPDLGGREVTVYKFTSPWGPEADEGKGIPNPSIRIGFDLDYGKTTILTYGFHGARYDRENGHMLQEFSIPEPRESGYGRTCYLLVLGEDIANMTTGCYVTGGTDENTKQTEGGVTVERCTADLDAVLREIVGCMVFRQEQETYSVDTVDFEDYYGLFCQWLVTEGALSDAGIDRYGSWLEMNDVDSQQRVFYLSAQVTIPAGGRVEVSASLRKAASTDFIGPGKNRSGYDMVTRLGSSLTFTGQRASLSHTEDIEITEQNFGFDLDSGIDTVALDVEREHYFLEVKRRSE